MDLAGLVLAPAIDIFGEPATYEPATGSEFSITGIFTEGFQTLTLLEDGSEITAVVPRLGVMLSQFVTAPVQNDRVLVRGIWYRVKEVRIDSHGRADLMLNQAPV